MTGAQEPDGSTALGTIFRVGMDVVVKLHGCRFLNENGCCGEFSASPGSPLSIWGGKDHRAQQQLPAPGGHAELLTCLEAHESKLHGHTNEYRCVPCWLF